MDNFKYIKGAVLDDAFSQQYRIYLCGGGAHYFAAYTIYIVPGLITT